LGTRGLRSLAVTLALLPALAGVGAFAQPDQLSEEAPPKPKTLELFDLRARYGVNVRFGGQTDLGPGMAYDGVTPVDLSLAGNLYFIDYLGLTASFQSEGFSLTDKATNTEVTRGSVFRLNAGAVGRLPLGPLRIEPYVAYAFHTLPTFTDSVQPTFASVTRHGILLAARLKVQLGPVEVMGKFELPLALAVVDASSRFTNAQGLVAGGSVRVQVLRTGHLWWGLAADGEYVRDTVFGPATDIAFVSRQEVGRFGLSVDVKWQDPPVEPPKFGGVAVTVVDAETGAPLPATEVSLEIAGSTVKLTPDAKGVASTSGLNPGTVVAKAALGGYLPAEASGEVKAGNRLPLALKLTKEVPKVGGLVVTVTRREAATPLAGANVTVGEKTVVTDERGVAKFDGLNPGPQAIAVTLAGYQPGSEAGNVVAGKDSDVAVALVPEKEKVPATISGIVRSTEGGKRIAAQLSIPELKGLKVKAAADGTFSLKAPAGTYSVTISAPGFVSQTKSVVVKDGDQAIFNVDLHPK
jgi:Carboxypeptidase regulatory-like domain